MARKPHDDVAGGSKLFARNLTARAAYLVAGNPISSRPESGVDNTHPGLELDVRNLDRFFFPGLRFDFQYRCGARLSRIAPDLIGTGSPLQEGDDNGSLVLWGICARFGDQPEAMAYVEVASLDGYDVLARIRDLEPKTELAIVISRPAEQIGLPGFQAVAKWMCTMATERGSTGGYASRDSSGELLFAVLTGKRADYLDEDGVIDPAAIEPGVLTQSLCSPWQWDFADCGCYYWAASRPDIVMDREGGPQTLNYQRQRDAEAPPTAPPPEQVPLTWREWIANQVTQPQMLQLWETLPVVHADAERPGGVVPLATPPVIGAPKVGLGKVIDELKFLAGVEHAVAVMYLYAAFSVQVPQGDGQNPPAPVDSSLSACAGELFRIAMDEMLHLRWVNDALALLDAAPALGRATGLRRPHPARLEGEPGGAPPIYEFELQPLTDSALDEFIAIERPSAAPHNPGQAGGVYVDLLDQVTRLRANKTGAQRDKLERLEEIIKLLIDEGHDHWDRFERIETELKKVPQDQRLRVKRGPFPKGQEPPDLTVLLNAADASYARLLDCLCRAYQVSGRKRARFIGQAIGAMLELQSHGEALAQKGAGMRFTLPSPCLTPKRP